MRVGFCGSRTYPRLDLVENFVAAMARKYAGGEDPLVVISGGAIGVDGTAETAAVMAELDVWSYRPKDTHVELWVSTKGGGFFQTATINGQGSYVRNCFFRNGYIAKADKVVAFWTLESTGTADTISKALGNRREVYVYGPDGMLLTPEQLRVAIDRVLG